MRSIAVCTLTIFGLSACGEEPKPTFLPEPAPIGDPVAYFGLAPCTCFEYVPEPVNQLGFGQLRLGVAVESVTEVFTPKKPQHLVRYRLNGQLKRTDFATPTDPDLLLGWVSSRGDNEDYWLLSPAISLLRGPVEPSRSWETSVLAKRMAFVTPTGEERELSVRVDTNSQQVAASLDGGEPKSIDAIRILFSTPADDRGLPWKDQVRWFSPGVGFVKMELTFDDQKRITWVLQNIRRLEGGCDKIGGFPPGDALPIDQICGI